MNGSQREFDPGRRVRTLLIDNYDSYTYNLYQLLGVVNGCEPVVVPNDVPWESVALRAFDNVVLSPGPGHPGNAADFGICARILERAEVPVLGVCLGHQGIAVAYGGRVEIGETLHGGTSAIFHDGGGVFAGLPQGFQAVRYHSLIVQPPLPEGLRVVARTAEGAVMGLEAVDRPLYGVQFHPESCLTEHGVKLLENFRDLTLAREERERCVVVAVRDLVAEAPRAEPRVVQLFAEPLALRVDAEPLVQSLFEERDRPIVWLDSACSGVGTGRFSYVALPDGPLGEVVRYDRAAHACTVTAPDGSKRVVPECGIFDYLDRARARLALDASSARLPCDFLGGYVGWIGYECKADTGFPTPHRVPSADAALLFADRLIAIDHERDDAWLIALALEGDEEAARAWLRAMRERCARTDASMPHDVARGCENATAIARPRRKKARYLRDIERCRELLRNGESYQICLSNAFEVENAPTAFEVHRRLRRRNPAPYAAYLDFGETRVACASPERFLRISPDGAIETKPIKGTAPRSADPLRDAELARALARSPKERAENLMIADLLRNDLGRVCSLGSVAVPALLAVESFAAVHHLVTTVRGTLREGASAVDALRACFPGGSMTGAPKLRAIATIDELEDGRGIYSGAIGYLGVNGAAEFNIVIRTLVEHDGEASLGAGGGITILSDGEREWEEVLLKARSVTDALGVPS